MATTVITQIKAFKVKLPEPVFAGGLLPEDEVIVLFEKSYDKNVFPNDPSWSFSFVGSIGTLESEVIPDLKYFFADGILQSGLARNATELAATIRQAGAEAKPLTLSDLRSVGVSGVMYRMDGELKHPLAAGKYKHFDWYGAEYAGFKVDTLEDISLLAQNGMNIDLLPETKWWQTKPNNMPRYLIDEHYGVQA